LTHSVIRIVPASPAHIGRIANRMREADRLETGAKGRSPKSALRLSLRSSTWACTALVDGDPHAMFGVAAISLIEDRGRPWFLGSDLVYQHPREMIRRGLEVVDLMHASFRKLENVVSVDNIRAIRLLRRWGFTVGEEEIMVGGVTFLPFWKVGDV